MSNDLLKPQKKLPFFILFFPIIIDIINGYVRGESGENDSIIGISYKGGIILISIIFLLNNPLGKYILLLISSLFIATIYHMICGYFTLSSLTNVIKIMYMYSICSILLGSSKCNNIQYVVNYGIAYGFTAAIVLIYSFVFKVGYSSYLENTYGTKGFFVAMNDIGLVLILMNALSCYFFLKTNKKIYFFAIVTITIGSMLVGSTSCFGGTLLVLLFLFCNIVFIRFSDYKSSRLKKILSLVIFYIIIIYVASTIIYIVSTDPYLTDKYKDIGSLIFKMSGRSYLMDASGKVISTFSFFDFLFGIGNRFPIEIQYILQYPDPKTTEVDPIDLFGMYGLIFSSLVIYVPVSILIKSILLFTRTKKISYYWISIGLSLYIFHGLYAGHAFTSPISSTYVAIFIYLYYKNVTK